MFLASALVDGDQSDNTSRRSVPRHGVSDSWGEENREDENERDTGIERGGGERRGQEGIKDKVDREWRRGEGRRENTRNDGRR